MTPFQVYLTPPRPFNYEENANTLMLVYDTFVRDKQYLVTISFRPT